MCDKQNGGERSPIRMRKTSREVVFRQSDCSSCRQHITYHFPSHLDLKVYKLKIQLVSRQETYARIL